MSVGWVAVGVSVVGMAAGAASASAGRSQAERLSNQSLAFQTEMFDWNKARAEKEDKLKEQATAGLWDAINTPGVKGFGDIESNIKGQYRAAAQGTDEALARSGITGSGLDAAMKQTNKLEEARTLSKAWQDGLMRKDDLRLKVAGQYNPNAAASLVRPPDFGPSIGMYSNQAAGAGAALGQIGQNLGNMRFGQQSGPQAWGQQAYNRGDFAMANAFAQPVQQVEVPQFNFNPANDTLATPITGFGG